MPVNYIDLSTNITTKYKQKNTVGRVQFFMALGAPYSGTTPSPTRYVFANYAYYINQATNPSGSGTGTGPFTLPNAGQSWPVGLFIV
jgi:hypothetical protein